MDIQITKQFAGGEIGRLANILSTKNVDVLSMQDGNTCQGGMTGVIYSRDCVAIFSEMSWFFLTDAHDDGQKFDSVDDYVWYAIEKHADEILGDWAALELIVQCAVCEQWQYTTDAYEHNDEHVCSRECLASIENAEEEEDA